MPSGCCAGGVGASGGVEDSPSGERPAAEGTLRETCRGMREQAEGGTESAAVGIVNADWAAGLREGDKMGRGQAMVLCVVGGQETSGGGGAQ